MTDQPATPIAALVHRMLSAECPPDIIVAAVETAERAALKSADSPIEKRRAYDRKRKREKRAASTGHSTGPQESLFTTSNQGTQSQVKKVSTRTSASAECPPDKAPKRTKGARLPQSWEPSAKHIIEGLDLGLTEKQVAGMAQDMRLWEQANHHRAVARKADWNATFSNWMRRQKRQPTGAAPRGGGSGFARLAARLAIEDATTRRGENDEPSSRPSLDDRSDDHRVVTL